MFGSLAGAAAFKKVTKVYKGEFRLFRQFQSIIIKVCLTVRLTGQTGTKVGYSDPTTLYGRVVAQRIKGTPGITG